MSDRPTDHLQPTSKRRPGQQLTKDDADDDDEDGPGYDPGTWGPSAKADGATLAKRKIIKARRAPGGAAPSPQPEPVGSLADAAAVTAAAPEAEAAPANPFAGRSLVAAAAAAPAANPFAGVALSAAAGKDAAAAAAPADKAEPAAPAAEPAKAAAAEEVTPPEGGAAAGGAEDKPEAAAAVGDGKPAGTSPTGAASVFGSGSSGGFGSFAGGGFGSFAGSTGGFGGFGSNGAAAPAGGGGLFSFAGGAGAAGSSKSMFGGFGGGASGDAKGAEGEQVGGEGEEGGGGGGGEEVFGGPEPVPVVTLEEVPKVTGEEAEVVLYTADGALFEFDAAAKTWHERGRGEFRINRDPETGAGRAVMRERASKRLILNARLYPTIPTSRMAPPQKGVTFAVANVAPAHAGGGGDGAAAEAKAPAGGEAKAAGGSGEGCGGGLATYALRLKTADAVDSLLAVVDAWKATAKVGGGGEDAV